MSVGGQRVVHTVTRICGLPVHSSTISEHLHGQDFPLDIWRDRSVRGLLAFKSQEGKAIVQMCLCKLKKSVCVCVCVCVHEYTCIPYTGTYGDQKSVRCRETEFVGSCESSNMGAGTQTLVFVTEI